MTDGAINLAEGTYLRLSEAMNRTRLEIPMLDLGKAALTIFDVQSLAPNEQDVFLIDLQQTTEGQARGPVLWFLGSKALARDAEIEPGIIKIKTKLYVATNNRGRPFPLPGIVTSGKLKHTQLR
jgi:hypothetical protein